MYEELKRVIDNSSVLQQGSVGDVVEEWVLAAEKELGLQFPPSYRWWLLNYGYGFLDGSPLYTIAPPDFKENADSDIVTVNENHKKNKMTQPGRLYFYEPDGDERFFFDMGNKLSNGDYAVMIDDLISQDVISYGGDFSIFLKNEIKNRSFSN